MVDEQMNTILALFRNYNIHTTQTARSIPVLKSLKSKTVSLTFLLVDAIAYSCLLSDLPRYNTKQLIAITLSASSKGHLLFYRTGSDADLRMRKNDNR